MFSKVAPPVEALDSAHVKTLTHAFLLLLALGSTSCEGCRGGSASKYCQDAIERTRGIDGAMAPADICKQCCVQDVPYEGRVEQGKCVCR